MLKGFGILCFFNCATQMLLQLNLPDNDPEYLSFSKYISVLQQQDPIQLTTGRCSERRDQAWDCSDHSPQPYGLLRSQPMEIVKRVEQ